MIAFGVRLGVLITFTVRRSLGLKCLLVGLMIIRLRVLSVPVNRWRASLTFLCSCVVLLLLVCRLVLSVLVIGSRLETSCLAVQCCVRLVLCVTCPCRPLMLVSMCSDLRW